MTNKSNTMTKTEYRTAQANLIEEAMEGDLCSIKVYPAQNRQLWFMSDEDRALCMIHRWIFFSNHISSKAPEDRAFSIYTYANLLLKAINTRLAPHPHRDILDYVEECLQEMVRLEIIDLLLMPNGNIGVCIRSSKRRPPEIQTGMGRYAEYKVNKENELNKQINLLDKCLTLSTND